MRGRFSWELTVPNAALPKVVLGSENRAQLPAAQSLAGDSVLVAEERCFVDRIEQEALCLIEGRRGAVGPQVVKVLETPASQVFAGESTGVIIHHLRICVGSEDGQAAGIAFLHFAGECMVRTRRPVQQIRGDGIELR